MKYNNVFIEVWLVVVIAEIFITCSRGDNFPIMSSPSLFLLILAEKYKNQLLLGILLIIALNIFTLLQFYTYDSFSMLGADYH